MPKVTRKRGGTVISVDLSDVQSGGLIPDGRYQAKIIEAEEKKGKESGEPYLQLTWEITSEKCNGRNVRFDNYSLQPQALFRYRALLESMGIDIEDKGATDVDFDDLIKDEAECIIEVVGDKAQDNNVYARVAGTYALGDVPTVDEDDRPKVGKGGRGKETPHGTRSSTNDDSEEEERDARVSRRSGKAAREEEEEAAEEPPARGGTKKLRKGATVRFKDERGKVQEGEIINIDKDEVTVETDKAEYVLEAAELTVID